MPALLLMKKPAAQRTAVVPRAIAMSWVPIPYLAAVVIFIFVFFIMITPFANFRESGKSLFLCCS